MSSIESAGSSSSTWCQNKNQFKKVLEGPSQMRIQIEWCSGKFEHDDDMFNNAGIYIIYIDNLIPKCPTPACKNATPFKHYQSMSTWPDVMTISPVAFSLLPATMVWSAKCLVSLLNSSCYGSGVVSMDLKKEVTVSADMRLELVDAHEVG